MTTIINELKEIINTAEICKSAYFWRNNGNSSCRAYAERKYNRPEITWTEGGDTYTAEYSFRQSREHTYAKGIYTKNGKTTTLTAIRNSYNRLLAENN